MYTFSFVTLIAIGILTLFTIMMYNRLVALAQYRKQSFADIDVQLKQRVDLIPNLVASVKGYASHEKGVLEEVTRARSQAMHTSGSGSDRAAAESGVSNALMNLLMVSENYPELKADARFQNLEQELSDIEYKIAAARRFFNSATGEYNAYLQTFPVVMVAELFGFKDEKFLEFDEAERKVMKVAPVVSFS